MASGGSPTAQFAIELDSSSASGSAKSAATALQELRDKINGDLAALREMQAAMRRLQGGTSVNVAAFRKLKDEIAAKKATIAAAEERYIRLGGTFDKVKKATHGVGQEQTTLMKALQGAGGPVGAYAGRIGGLVEMLKKLGGARVLAVGALVAVTAATVVAYGALARYGLAQADAYRSEGLRLEGLTKLRRWYGLAAGSATHLQGAIDRVSATAAIGRPEVAGYAQQLYMMGLRGKNLDAALEATVIKASTQGERWAGTFMNMAAGANMLGQSVVKMSDTVKARLGGIAEKQAIGFSVQMMKLRQNVGGLFKGLNIEPFLKGLNTVLSLFSETTSTGRALKVLFETLLNPFFASAEGGAPIAKRFIQGLVIGALVLAIAFFKVRNALRDVFGDSKILSGAAKQKAALYLGIGVAILLGSALAVLAGWLIVIAAGAALAAAPFVLLGGIIAGAIGYIIASIGELKKDWDILEKASWGDLANAMLMGIVDGITAGAKWVWDAIKNLGKGMIKRFKEVLKISSPSGAMKVEARFVPIGAAEGVKETTPLLERASFQMAKAVRFPEIRAPRVRMPEPELRAETRRGPELEVPKLATPRFALPEPEKGPAVGRPRFEKPEARSPVRAPIHAPVAPVPPPPPERRTAERAARSGPLVSISELHIHSQAKDVEGLKEDIRREVERIFEGVAVQLGAVVAQ